jgi:hypothetical protein
MKVKRKILIIFFFGLTINVIHAQNKKEQIEALNFSIDSLKKVVISNNISLLEKTAIISNRENEIEKLNSKINQLNAELSIKDIELQKSLVELNSVKLDLQSIKDSIAIINSSKKLDTLIWEFTDITWEQMEFDLKILMPTSNFEKPNSDVLQSKDKKTTLFFEYNQTYWMDEYEGNPLFFSLTDAINYYSKGLYNPQIQHVQDGFVITGQNSSKELIFIKGLYTDFSSMQGRSTGSPQWLWSNTIVLKIVVNQADLVAFNNISEIVNKEFTVNCISSK